MELGWQPILSFLSNATGIFLSKLHLPLIVLTQNNRKHLAQFFEKLSSVVDSMGLCSMDDASLAEAIEKTVDRIQVLSNKAKDITS